jgi:hypothetical protein
LVSVLKAVKKNPVTKRKTNKKPFLSKAIPEVGCPVKWRINQRPPKNNPAIISAAKNPLKNTIKMIERLNNANTAK